jgi:hypothetical protein
MTSNGDSGGWLGYGNITQYAKDHPDMGGEAIGQALTRDATEAQLRAWAVAEVAGIVEAVRRAWARDAEARAAKAARAAEAAAGELAEFGRLLNNPAAFYGERSYYGTARQRARFRQWAGDRFGEWWERARQAAADARGEQGVSDFESDWHERSAAEYHRQRARERQDEAIRLAVAETELRLTREFLGTAFALGDGTETTWGQATIAQHEQRVELLARNAAGVVQTAARHQAAIGMIKDAGVECLADLGAGR